MWFLFYTGTQARLIFRQHGLGDVHHDGVVLLSHEDRFESVGGVGEGEFEVEVSGRIDTAHRVVIIAMGGEVQDVEAVVGAPIPQGEGAPATVHLASFDHRLVGLEFLAVGDVEFQAASDRDLLQRFTLYTELIELDGAVKTRGRLDVEHDSFGEKSLKDVDDFGIDASARDLNDTDVPRVDVVDDVGVAHHERVESRLEGGIHDEIVHVQFYVGETHLGRDGLSSACIALKAKCRLGESKGQFYLGLGGMGLSRAKKGKCLRGTS